MRENRRFNRYETERNHFYQKEFGSAGGGTISYQGYIKCKLVHAQRGSVIVPDQIFLEDRGTSLLWIQPLAFMANSIAKHSDGIECLLPVDIAMGYNVVVHFHASGYVRSYPDGSQLFRCEIIGPYGLPSYATGRARINGEHRIQLDLYHHTTADSRRAILKSRTLRGSPWNIQGNRRMENVSYGYLTPLDRIVNDDDLREIAMASDGRLQFLRDNVMQPLLIDDTWRRRHANDLLELTVYRESTANRTATVKFSVDAAVLAPQHVLMHSPADGAVFYEVNSPMIHRIGVAPGGEIRFNAAATIREQPSLKRFQYLVLGDASILEGLAGPYDEENTTSVFKIEMLADGIDMLTFWMENANQDHFSGKRIEFQRVGAVVPD
jgi:hypothetical protein